MTDQLTTEPVIIPLTQPLLQKHRHSPKFLPQPPLQFLFLPFRNVQAGPAVPFEFRALRQTAEGCHETARALREGIGVWGGALDGDGEAIRYDKEAVRWGRGNGWFDHLESRDCRGNSDNCNCIDSCGITMVDLWCGRKEWDRSFIGYGW